MCPTVDSTWQRRVSAGSEIVTGAPAIVTGALTVGMVVKSHIKEQSVAEPSVFCLALL